MFFAPSEPLFRAKFGTYVFQRQLIISKSRSRYQIPVKNLKHPRKSQIQDFKDMDVLCTLKFKIESQNSEHRCNKDQWLYENKGQDANPQSGTSNILQSLKSRLKGHECSLHLQNQAGVPKCGSWVYQRQVIISKSISRCIIEVRDL